MFSLALGLSVFLNGTDLDALMWLSILILGSGGVYFVAANHYNQKIAAMDLLKIISTIATILAIIAIAEYITGYNPFCAIHHSSEHWIRRPFEQPRLGYLIRARSSIGHPLVLSSFLVFVLPVTLYLAFKKDRKFFWVLSTAIQYLGIFVTFSRSSYLLGILLLLNYLIRFKVITINFQRFIFITGSLTILVGTGLFLLYRHENLTAFLERVSFRTGKGSFLFRLDAWSLAGDFIAINPVVGAGIRKLPVFISKELPLYPLTTFDNTFLDLFFEIGIVGLVSYILFILAPMISIYKSNKTNFGSFLALTVGIIMIYYGFIFNVVYHQIIWITYWTLQGLFLMLRNSNSYEVSK
jgi:O-antigen ligase